MMELFDRVLNKSPVFISYFNKYFVDNFDESIANINVKLYCQTFLMLLSLMLNIHLFLWHINTATFLAENNMNQHTDGRLAILNADHMFSFDSMVVLKISLSKKIQFADAISLLYFSSTNYSEKNSKLYDTI